MENQDAERTKRLSHLKNLVMMASQDGLLGGTEYQLIEKIGLSLGFSSIEVARLMQNFEQIPQFIPDTFEEKIGHMYDLVRIMLIDGEIHKRELRYCQMAALKVGFLEDQAIELIVSLIDVVKKEGDLTVALAMARGKFMA